MPSSVRISLTISACLICQIILYFPEPFASFCCIHVLSACARSECTAGPLDLFSILDWINVWSILFPISPPSASTSLTRCPLELPPIFGLHGISAILSTLTVNTIVSKPSLCTAPAPPHTLHVLHRHTASTSVYIIILLHLYFPIQNLLKYLIYQIFSY